MRDLSTTQASPVALSLIRNNARLEASRCNRQADRFLLKRVIFYTTASSTVPHVKWKESAPHRGRWNAALDGRGAWARSGQRRLQNEQSRWWGAAETRTCTALRFSHAQGWDTAETVGQLATPLPAGQLSAACAGSIHTHCAVSAGGFCLSVMQYQAGG